jgi:DNA polymerase-3 subunit alpha
VIIKKKIWNLHSHSQFSANDALPRVQDMVDTVVGYGQPALGLTDHGNMAGSAQLYKACKQAGILPFPGSELYIVNSREDKKAKRHHMCVVAYSTEGYNNLCNLSSMSNVNFYNKPLLDMHDLAELSSQGLLKGIAGTSGCYFGFVVQAIATGDMDRAKSILCSYAKWFGDKFYVELQNHNIDHGNGLTDDSVADILLDLATELGIPAILTQDSHYCDQHDKVVHETLKRLVAYGSDSEDAVFPGDGFHLADTEWFVDHHNERRLSAGTEGLSDLLDSHTLQIKELDSYSYNIPFTVEDPLKEISDRCYLELEKRDLLKPAYQQRLQEELEVIEHTRMAGYLNLVAEVTDWCANNTVYTTTRGSASGSLVCWLLKITQVDPIKYGLSFERFISKDRTKPPDVDLDVEHEQRDKLISWLSERFAVTQIGTWLTHSLTGDDESGKGSIRVRYYASKRRQGAVLQEWNQIPSEEKNALFKLADNNAISSYGTHAAGLVVTTTKSEFDKLIPTMWVASSETMVTQYPMDDIEDFGMVKLDVLGSKTLTVINKTIKMLGRDFSEGLDWIPLNDSKTFTAISKGDTDGVFQLEGWTTKREISKLKPTKLRDVVDAMALFRPATMNSGATETYLSRRAKKTKIPQRHEFLMATTNDTQGIFLFQEQVISVLREIGLEAVDLTKFLKAVKASNSNIGGAGDVIQGFERQIKQLCDDYGFNSDDYEFIWESATGFAAYGFNKAHSMAYGVTAYRCAYLMVHYPVEFHTALLDVSSGSPKEDNYVSATRARNIKIKIAHVNESNESYTISKNGKYIRKGLRSIKGLGPASAKKIVAARPEDGYESTKQFARLTKVSGTKPYLETGDMEVGTFGKLYENRAFEGLSDE